jgi:hypothetical protein
MIYYLSSNNINSVGDAPLYRSAPWSLGQVIRRIHISVTYVLHIQGEEVVRQGESETNEDEHTSGLVRWKLLANPQHGKGSHGPARGYKQQVCNRIWRR